MPPAMEKNGRLAVLALRESVNALPSTIARLVFLSGLRDVNTGSYCVSIVCTATERAEVDQLLRDQHERTFSTWLSYGLEQQKADLELYFSGLDCAKATVIETWLHLKTYQTLVPASANTGEGDLFRGDLELLLRVMANESGLATSATSRLERGVSTASLLTTKDLSKWFGVPARSLRFWAEVGEIPAIKMGRQWRFQREVVREWMRTHRNCSLDDILAAARRLRQ